MKKKSFSFLLILELYDSVVRALAIRNPKPVCFAVGQSLEEESPLVTQ